MRSLLADSKSISVCKCSVVWRLVTCLTRGWLSPTFLNMKTLNVSRAKAGFSGIARRVIKTRESAIVKTPTGYVQIVPFDVPDFVPPAEKGSIRLTDREVELANRLGESL